MRPGRPGRQLFAVHPLEFDADNAFRNRADLCQNHIEERRFRGIHGNRATSRTGAVRPRSLVLIARLRVIHISIPPYGYTAVRHDNRADRALRAGPLLSTSVIVVSAEVGKREGISPTNISMARLRWARRGRGLADAKWYPGAAAQWFCQCRKLRTTFSLPGERSHTSSCQFSLDIDVPDSQTAHRCACGRDLFRVLTTQLTSN